MDAGGGNEVKDRKIQGDNRNSLLLNYKMWLIGKFIN